MHNKFSWRVAIMQSYNGAARRESFINQLLFLATALYAFLLPFGKESVALYCVVLLFLLLPNLKEKLALSFQNKFVASCALFFTIIVLWSWSTHDTKLALGQIKGALILLVPIVFFHVVTQSNRKIFFFLFLLSFFITVFFSYLIFFGIIENTFHFENRIVGEPLAFLYKTDFTTILNSLIFFLIGFLTRHHNAFSVWKKAFFATLIALLALNLFFIGSRTAVVVFALCAVFTVGFFWLTQRTAKKTFLILVSASLFVAFLGFSLNQYQQHFSMEAKGIANALGKKDYFSSAGARVGLWKYGIEAYMEGNLLFGSGTKNQLEATHAYLIRTVEDVKNKQEYQEVLRVLGSKSGLHNGYVDVLTQHGLLGIICFVSIFYFLVFHNRQREEEESFLFLRYILGLIVGAGFLTGGDFAAQKLGNIFVFFAALVHFRAPIAPRKTHDS